MLFMMERIDRLSNHFVHESFYWRAIFSGFFRLKEPRSPDQNKSLVLTKASIKVERISMQSAYRPSHYSERSLLSSVESKIKIENFIAI